MKTLQDKIDYFTITARQMGSDYYWSSIEPHINKAIQELRDEIQNTPTKIINGIEYIPRTYTLLLIGEKK